MRDLVLRPRSSASLLRPVLRQRPAFAFRFALLAVLLAAGMTAPLRLPAQEPPAAPAASASEAAKPEAADSEQAQTNVFRLEGPVVRWTAKTFHLSPETAATTFEIINFLIVVLGLGYPLARWLPGFLRGRKEKLRSDLDSARKAVSDASTRLSAIEAKLAGLDGEIAQIRAQVEAESLEDEKRIQSSLQQESARIVAAAEQEIGASAAQARRSLRNFAADLAISQAAEQLVLSAETDQALIAEFLSDAALNPDTALDPAPGDGAKQGGQN